MKGGIMAKNIVEIVEEWVDTKQFHADIKHEYLQKAIQFQRGEPMSYSDEDTIVRIIDEMEKEETDSF